VTLNVEEPLPELLPDDHHNHAWVVLLRNKVPIGMLEVDLTTGSGAVKIRLQEFLARNQSQAPEPPPLADSELPSITVVLASIIERIEELGRCIDSLGNVDYQDFEVLLVDNRRELPAKDPLPPLVEGRPWLRVIREERPGVSMARNAGLAQAKGAIVAFTDDDVRVDREWLRAIGTRFATNPHLDAVTGLILPAELETPAQIWFERYYGGFGGLRTYAPVTLAADHNVRPSLRGSRILVRNSSDSEVLRSSVYGIGAYVAGANMAFRRSSLEKIGGFNNALGGGTPARGGEDLSAIISILWADGQVGYEPGAFVYHQHRRQYSKLVNQLEGYGVGFTALLTSLARDDRRHVLSLLSQLPSAIRRKILQGAKLIRGSRSDSASKGEVGELFPSELVRIEYLAYLRGPLAYERSRKIYREIVAQPSP
jgi:glycosyltransferase involved in cell wall biosynthesis